MNDENSRNSTAAAKVNLKAFIGNRIVGNKCTENKAEWKAYKMTKPPAGLASGKSLDAEFQSAVFNGEI